MKEDLLTNVDGVVSINALTFMCAWAAVKRIKSLDIIIHAYSEAAENQ